MAQLVVAAAGAALGSMLGPGALFLGMTGGQLGWMAGSLLGSMLNKPPAQHGPRLDDSALRVTGTEYGQCIPWVAGAPRLPGVIVWASDRRETATTEEVGKGGGQEYTTYSYDIDVMYLVADRPGCVVTRIWMNGKIAWTSLASSDDASRLASDGTEKWTRLTVYDGNATQLPDPTYDAAVTAAPAYRGRTTVFIEGLQLGNSGALPNFTFEVASDAGESDEIVRRYAVDDIGVGNRYRYGSFTGGLGVPVIRRILPSIAVESYAPSPAIGSRRGATLTGDFGPWPDGYSPATLGDWNGWELNLYEATTFSHPVAMIDGQAVRVQRFWHQGPTTAGTGSTILSIGSIVPGIVTSGTDLTAVLPSGKYIGAVFPCTDGMHLLICTADTDAGGAGEKLSRWYMTRRSAGATTLVRQGAIDTSGSGVMSLGSGVYGHGSFTGYSSGAFEDDLTHVWWAYGAGDLFVTMGTIGDDGVLRLADTLKSGAGIPGSTGFSSFSATSCWAEAGYCVVVAGGTYSAFRRAGTEIRPVPLRSVVDKLCDRAGMPAGTYDASALDAITRPVRALAIPQISSTRATLDMLMTSHAFVSALSDKLYFFPRSAGVDASVAWGDLGTGEGDASDDPLAIDIGNDLELPARMAVQYRNMNADQQVGVEYSDRVISGQASVQPMQMALGMLPSEAKGVADALQLDGMAAQVSASVSVPLSYAKLWPGSVVTVNGWDDAQYRMRVQRREDDGLMLKLALVGDDPAALESQGITDSSYVVVSTVRALDGTTFEVLDIPILRDDDDSLGYYIAARAASAGRWPGAVVQASRDSVSYSTVATVSEQAVIGRATTVLAAWAGGHVMDEVSSVTVDVGAGELSSVTREQLLGDATLNALLVGGEVIRFCTATLQSAGPNVYKLTRLLRGQRGTEWAMAGHAIGDRVVLLRPRGLRRVASDAADLAVPQSLRAATVGTVASDAAPGSFTLAGVGLKPFAPTNLRRQIDGIGTLSLIWERRTRRTTVIRNGVGVQHPLGEAAEAYEVDVFSAANVLQRTIQSAQASVSLSQASVLGSYARNMQDAFEYGGYLYGTSNAVFCKADPATRAIVVQSPPASTWATVGTAGNLGAIGVRWACHDGAGSVFLGLNQEVDAYGQTQHQRIVKLDLATLSTATVLDIFAASGIVADSGVCTGGKLYMAGTSGGNPAPQKVARVNASTMAYEAVSASFGEFGQCQVVVDHNGKIVLAGVDGGDIVQIDGPTLAQTSRATIGAGRGVWARVFGNKLVLHGTGKISTVNLDTFSVIAQLSRQSYGYVAAYGSLAAVQLSAQFSPGMRDVQVVIIDPATGQIAGNVDIGQRILAGARASTLLAYESGFPHGTCYELSPAGDLSGGRAVVYQISATVGRGYPAEIPL